MTHKIRGIPYDGGLRRDFARFLGSAAENRQWLGVSAEGSDNGLIGYSRFLYQHIHRNDYGYRLPA